MRKNTLLVLLAVVALFVGSFGTSQNESIADTSTTILPVLYTVPVSYNVMTHVRHVADCTAHNASDETYKTDGANSVWCDNGLSVPVVSVALVTNDTESTHNPIIIDTGGVQILEDKPTQESKCKNGNPGNKKCKGNSGENPNNKGTMSKDSTDGNGEHGNQGINTHGNNGHNHN